MRKACSAALLFSFAASAMAQVWVPMGETSEGQMYLDVTSVRPQGKYLKVWDKWVLKLPFTTTGYPAFTFRSSKGLTYYDCSSGTYASKQISYFEDAEGAGKNVYNTHVAEAQLRFEDPIPDSVGRRMFDWVCRGRK